MARDLSECPKCGMANAWHGEKQCLKKQLEVKTAELKQLEAINKDQFCKLIDLKESYISAKQWEKQEKALLSKIAQLNGELYEAQGALHYYRDNASVKCSEDHPDMRRVAGNLPCTGLRAAEALKRMPIAVKMRHDAYERECRELDGEE